MTEKEVETPDLVDEFLKPAPSLPFVLKRKQEDGSVKEIPYRCRLLRLDQMADILRAAEKYAGKDEGDLYREAQAHETIQRVMMHPEPRDDGTYRPKFVDADHVRRSLDEVECAQILTTHQLTREHFRMTGRFTPEDVSQMTDALADEMAGPYFLSQWDSADWVTIILEQAREIQSLRKLTGRVPSSSPSSLESDPESSDPGITGSMPELSLQLSEQESVSVPIMDRIMTREEARAFVLEQQKKPPKDEEN